MNESNWALIIQLIVACFFAISIIINWRSFQKNRDDKKEEKAKWAARIETEVSHLQRDVKDIKSGLDKLQEYIYSLFGAPAAYSKSPLKLTEFGKELSHYINAKDWAKGKAVELSTKTKGKEPFEIHEISEKYVKHMFQSDNETARDVKRTSYEKGTTIRLLLFLRLN